MEIHLRHLLFFRNSGDFQHSDPEVPFSGIRTTPKANPQKSRNAVGFAVRCDCGDPAALTCNHGTRGGEMPPNAFGKGRQGFPVAA